MLLVLMPVLRPLETNWLDATGEGILGLDGHSETMYISPPTVASEIPSSNGCALAGKAPLEMSLITSSTSNLKGKKSLCQFHQKIN